MSTSKYCDLLSVPPSGEHIAFAFVALRDVTLDLPTNDSQDVERLTLHEGDMLELRANGSWDYRHSGSEEG